MPKKSTTPKTTTKKPINVKAVAEVPVARKRRFGLRLSRRKTAIIAVVFLAIVAAVAAIEPSRFFVLNLVGDTSATIKVADSETKQPVEGATITMKGQVVKTGRDGMAALKNMPYGTVAYTITKENYGSFTGSAKLTAETNVLTTATLRSQGNPVSFTLTNTLTDKAIGGYVIKIDGSNISAVANKDGKATIKVPTSKLGSVGFTASSDGYNDVALRQDVGQQSGQSFSLTTAPAGKHYFLSSRTGVVALYSVNLDGSNMQLVIASGADRTESGGSLMVSPDNKHALWVSGRDNLRNASGQRLSGLYMVDLTAKTIKRIGDGAYAFGLVGWANDTKAVFYTKAHKYPGQDTDTFTVSSVTTSGAIEQLLSRKDWSDVYTFAGAPNMIFLNNYGFEGLEPSLLAMNVDTKVQTQLLKTSVDSYRQYVPGRAMLQAGATWYDLNLKTSVISETDQPDETTRYGLAVSSDGLRSTWFQKRDNTTLLAVGDKDGRQQKTFTNIEPATDIVGFAGSDYVIYKTYDAGRQPASILSISTGKTTKISDN